MGAGQAPAPLRRASLAPERWPRAALNVPGFPPHIDPTGLLEGEHPSRRNRTVVQSGLQSYNFGADPAPDPNADPAAAAADAEDGQPGFNFRLAVLEHDGVPYKFVCCLGKCPGSPSTVGPPDADGYTRLLFDTVADPYDMEDVKARLPHVAETLRAALPVQHGFNCSRLATVEEVGRL